MAPSMFREKDTPLWILLCFWQQYNPMNGAAEEISGTFHFEMSWDETKDTLKHQVWMTDDQGANESSVTDNTSLRAIEDGNNRTSQSHWHKARHKREALPEDYVRHGPQCLKRQKQLVKEAAERRKNKGKGVHVVVMVEEEEEARMTCHYCNQDEEHGRKETTKEKDEQRKAMLWYRLSPKKRGKYYKVKEVETDMHDDPKRDRIFITDTHTLVVRKAKVKDAGTYFCRDTSKKEGNIKKKMEEADVTQFLESDKQLRFLYHMDVLKDSNVDAKIVTTAEGNETNSNLPKASPPHADKARNVLILTVWQEWSSCSICDKPGTRRRLGECTVQKLVEAKAASPWFLESVLASYEEGIPCRSSVFQGHKKLLTKVSRPEEVEEEACEVECANYSIKASDLLVPTHGKLAKVKEIQYVEPEGDEVVLKCPKTAVDMPVAWLNGSRVLVGPWLKGMTDGRVRIDEHNSLHVDPLLPWDKGHYACVVGGLIKGRVRLEVTPKPGECKSCRYALYLLMSYPFDFAVFAVFLYVRHKERQKVLNYDLLPTTDTGKSKKESTDEESDSNDEEENDDDSEKTTEDDTGEESDEDRDENDSENFKFA